MAAVKLEVQETSRAGRTVKFYTPDPVDGVAYQKTAREAVLLVRNLGVAPITVSVYFTQAINILDTAGITITVGAGSTAALGPYSYRYTQPDGYVRFGFSSITNVSVALVAAGSLKSYFGFREGVFDYTHRITVSNGVYTATDVNGWIISMGADLKTVFNAVKASGRHIRFGPGTFDLGIEHITFNGLNNLAVTGSGVDVTILKNNTNAAEDSEPLSYTRCNFMTVRDLTISAGGSARSTADALDFDACNDCLVENVKVVQSRARGIVFDGKENPSERNTIRSCTVIGVPGAGIELLASSYCLIQDCTVTGCSATVGAGISIAKGSATAVLPNKKSTYNIVSGGLVEYNKRDGVRLLSSDNNEVRNVTIRNNSQSITTGDGVRFQTADGISVDNNLINGVTANDTQATRTQRYGVNVAPAAVNLANNNTIQNCNFRFNKTASTANTGTGTVFTNNLT